jgi:5-dehydro-2-deoxygluconokinase
MPTDLQLLTVGRISVDLYASEPGKGWDEVGGFVKAVGGTATNVAVAASRLGHRCAVLTKVGADPFGAFLRRRLADFGVDTRFVGTSETLRTPLAFAVLERPDDPELLFYREPLAPDLTIGMSDVDAGVLDEVEVFWATGPCMSAEPSASTTVAMLARRGRRQHTVVDLDYRPMFWSSPAAARRGIGSLVEYATVAVGNRIEFEIAVGTADPEQAASRLLDAGVELVVVKMGGEGVLVATPRQSAVVPPVSVEVVCGLGAGDAFGGALVHGLLEGWDPLRAVTFANAAGALVASRLLCADAMGTEAEINALLEGSASGTR